MADSPARPGDYDYPDSAPMATNGRDDDSDDDELPTSPEPQTAAHLTSNPAVGHSGMCVCMPMVGWDFIVDELKS